MLRASSTSILFVVEGPNDAGLLWAVFGLLSDCVVIAYNKQNLDEATSILGRDGTPGVLAIRDRDFDTLSSNEIVVLTDTYDLDMHFILAGALERLLEGFGSQEKIRKKLVSIEAAAHALLDGAEVIGALRYYCSLKGIAATFDGLDGAILNESSLKICSETLFKSVLNKTAPDAKRQLEAGRLEALDYQAVLAQKPPRWMCVSHDLLWLLHISLRKALGSLKSSECGPDTLRRSLRSVAVPAHIVGTPFYKRLHAAVLALSHAFSFRGRALPAPT